MRLRVQVADLFLELLGPGQEGLIQLGGDVDRYAGRLVIPTGLAAQADVDGKRHESTSFAPVGR
jgi:hypothetical protein